MKKPTNHPTLFCHKLFIVFFTTLFLASCSSMVEQLVQTPEVKGVSLKSFSVADKSVVFDVDLFNPNAFPLPISGMNGNIQLNQQNIGSLAAQSEGSLPANSTQKISIPLSLDTDALFNAAQKMLTSQKAEYNFNGAVETSLGNVPVSKSGDLSVTEIMSALTR